MRASDLPAPRQPPVFDPPFLRRLVWATGATPGVVLAWDALRHALGVHAANYAIRTTGMLTLVFLVLVLVVTPLRKITGFAALIAVRRSLGLFASFYLTVHLALFYGLDRAADLGSTLHEIATRRYLQLGTTAVVLMIPLALTSTDAMVRRIGAKKWKRLHRLTYVVAVLGCIHYALLVKADVRQPLAFAAVVAALLAYRAFVAVRGGRSGRPHITDGALVATPRKRPWSGELRIVRIVQETHDVRTLRLAAPAGGPLPFQFAPGQYLNVTFELGDRIARRSYTIASSAAQTDLCEITVKRTEDGWVSRHIHEALSEGGTIRVSAPAGRFVFDPMNGDHAERVTLIGGGVGVTPLMSILRSLSDRRWTGLIDMILSVRTEDDVIFADELAALADRLDNLRLTLLLTRGTSMAAHRRSGRLTKETLAELLGPSTEGPHVFVGTRRASPIYLCGPDAMMRDVKAALRALGVDDERIRTEAFVSPGTSTARSEPDADEPLRQVTFERSDLVVAAPRRLTLLEAAEASGLELPFECRSGVCGQCKIKLLEGDVTMDAEDALSFAEKAAGIVLACQARAQTDVIVDE